MSQSWQAKALTAYIRLRNILNRPPKKLDLAWVRADSLDRFQFKALAPAECQPVTVNGLPAEWLTPAGVKTGRTLLFLHGGGFVRGTIEDHRSLAINIAYVTHARALNLGYRVAPEHPFPAAPEDCLAAYRWLLSEGVRPEQLLVSGISAGGSLTLVLLLSLRDSGLPLPAAAICLSPWMDLAMKGASYTSNARSDLFYERFYGETFRQLYLGDHDPCDPHANPLYADLHGLPPLLIQVGQPELVLSDSTMFAERARTAGVHITLDILERGQHGEQVAARFLPEAREALKHIGDFVERHLG